MGDLKVALIERSRTDRVSVSSLVREFVATGLGREGARRSAVPAPACRSDPSTTVKLSLRITAAEALQLAHGAEQAGLSRPAYLAALIAGRPQIISSSLRSEQLALLVATNAELSTLGRNVRHLATLLGRGSDQAVHAYDGMLRTIVGDVRRHLAVSAALMAEMRPPRSAATALPGRANRPKRAGRHG